MVLEASVSDLDGYLSFVDLACNRLDRLQEYSTMDGDGNGLFAMHGLTMYARDTARAAALLLRNGMTCQAGALARVVLEHAVVLQWLKADPEQRGQLFLKHGMSEHARWFKVVLAADFDLSRPEFASLGTADEKRGAKPPKSPAPELDSVQTLFGQTEVGRKLYLVYRNLSQFVHPSWRALPSYAERLEHGQELKTSLQVEQPPTSVAHYLASGLAMCALPYLTMLDELETAIALGVAAQVAGVTTALD